MKEVIVTVVVVMGAMFGWSALAEWRSEPPGVEQITEDDPRWDCETMGNRICGPMKQAGIGMEYQPGAKTLELAKVMR